VRVGRLGGAVRARLLGHERVWLMNAGSSWLRRSPRS
jgi:hypothetical protein